LTVIGQEIWSAIMALTPSVDTYYVTPFDPVEAMRVATWTCDEKELFWLAPKTAPPLTAAKIIDWTRDRGQAYLFYQQGHSAPRGYFELNPMPNSSVHLWAGHCVIDPQWRGIGLGRQMTALMIREAFASCGAQRLSLVVFPDNLQAIRCYEVAGFQNSGRQLQCFSRTGKQHLMRCMSISREEFLRNDPSLRSR
jgi:RimJ/RimL family protein N-acetyltransferase